MTLSSTGSVSIVEIETPNVENAAPVKDITEVIVRRGLLAEVAFLVRTEIEDAHFRRSVFSRLSVHAPLVGWVTNRNEDHDDWLVPKARKGKGEGLVGALSPLVDIVRRGAILQLSQSQTVGASDILIAVQACKNNDAIAIQIAAQVMRMFASVARRIQIGTAYSTIVGRDWNFRESFPEEIYFRFPVEIGNMSKFSEDLYKSIYEFLQAGGEIHGTWGNVQIDAQTAGGLNLEVSAVKR